MKAFQVAVSFLTRIPVLGVGNVQSNTLSKSIIFFPIVGGIIGAVIAGVYLLLEPFVPRSVLSVFIVAVPIFMTGGIHFDGLLDTSDGIFSGRSRERSLEIMRDSRVGSMGVIAGILNVFLRYSVLIELPGAILPMLLITQPVTGRWVMAMAVYFFPYARKEGGLGQGFTTKKEISNIIISSLFALVIILVANGISGIVIALIAVSVALLIACWVAGKLGGLTGDVYGCLNEVAENIFLLLWLIGSITFHIH
ncbi:MAG: adenosylcobinamide-GDP ribazoletransferase [Syntrophomonadaceae bacterium]|nr:adenosylcobinamide-GDP ribazoletransferase [Syntrophomonadaceae bacterium]MDD3889132.1 adenosylcobinamide-GDP ribazoletransferase [Syntrophomonadaceae bacterium]MDD4549548.1 adenosylcobinamide-GDP ribazoletransferase [Syntrophomonadaceae bacterium]